MKPMVQEWLSGLTNRQAKQKMVPITEQSELIYFLLRLQFRDVAKARYLTTERISSYLHGIMSDYFLGTWADGKPKPFK